MGSNDLKALFLAQQTRRQVTLSGVQAIRRPSSYTNSWTARFKAALFVFLAIILASATLITILDYSSTPSSGPVIQGTLPAQVIVVTATPTEIQFVLDRKVCTDIPEGHLNVRFSPIGPVRGYLKEGEAVKLSTDPHTGDIQVQDIGSLWLHLQSPIEGWVNSRYICSIEGEEN